MAITGEPLDPFDLPEWLLTAQVTWGAESAGLNGPRLPGRLRDTAGHSLACDLLAVDDAFPAPVAEVGLRTAAHQAWRHGQGYLVTVETRLTVVVPGDRFHAELVLEALARLARAVGASPQRYAALLPVATGEPEPAERADGPDLGR